MVTRVKPQSGLKQVKPYIPGTPIEDVQREYGLTDVIKLASNENPFGTSPKALEAIAGAIHRINQYPDSQSYQLRCALAEHHGLDAEQIIAGNGMDGLLAQVAMSYLDQGSEVVESGSSFPFYDLLAHTMRARPVKVPLKGYGLDLQAMADAIGPRTAVVFVCNPNNPTGTIVPAREVAAFMERVPGRVLVVFDEAYYELVASDEFPDTADYVRQGRENVLVLRTFSKVYGLAGIRLGYGLAMPRVLAPMYAAREPFAVNTLAQAAGIAALQDQDFRRKTVQATHASRLWLYGQFERLGLSYVESHTNFILVHIGPHAQEVQQELLKLGVIVRPCAAYDLHSFLRVTVGTLEQDARFIEALEDVLRRLKANA